VQLPNLQERLVRMLSEITGMQLYCMQLARLEESGQLTDTIASLAKYNNTRTAREIIANARDMLGGNGVLLENHVVRHMGDIEVLDTYEGTATMQALIVERDITGVGASREGAQPAGLDVTRAKIATPA
jgi:glutaryl-CoA dehydrogenase